MIRESKLMLKNLNHHFQRKYNWRYSILVVDNRFYSCYSLFLQAHHHPDLLHYSWDLVEFEHDKAKYGQVMRDLKQHCNLSIEYRDTDHLVHPGTDIVFDASHGHGFSTSYHTKKA
jgi:hypothetical protein